ncbi:hypothetical protein ACIBJC_29945 [Streptomyces sp. NPDC050509]|uniref:hypothetical protein n=1 Tax=Streptomyces sp. NPDC050509 TaxID=3365620 RepID=UPI003797A3A7
MLQQANDWREKHPEESIAPVAEMLDASPAQAKADASHVETFPTDDLVPKTGNGEIGRALTKLGDLFVHNKQWEKAPDPAEFYDGDLYRKVHAGQSAAGVPAVGALANLHG